MDSNILNEEVQMSKEESKDWGLSQQLAFTKDCLLAAEEKNKFLTAEVEYLKNQLADERNIRASISKHLNNYSYLLEKLRSHEKAQVNARRED